MVEWREMVRKLALARGGVIDPKRAAIIKGELLADGKIDKDEFAFLVRLRRESHWIDPQLDDVIFNAIAPRLLEDGCISLAETKWLQNLLNATASRPRFRQS